MFHHGSPCVPLLRFRDYRNCCRIPAIAGILPPHCRHITAAAAILRRCTLLGLFLRQIVLRPWWFHGNHHGQPWTVIHHGRSMKCSWTVHGPTMDCPWTHHGLSMDERWTVQSMVIHGVSMVVQWTCVAMLLWTGEKNKYIV